MLVSTLLLATLSSLVVSQAVPEGIEPEQSPPEGCERTVDGNFTIGIGTFVGAKSRRETAQEAAGTALQCTLKDGVLKDPYGRVGSVVANYQFQFDGPPQAGAIYTGGFSRCENGSLAIGGSTVWYRCMSGDFGNLYDRSIGDQCTEVRIVARMVDQPSSSSSSTASSTVSSTVSSSGSSSSSSSSLSVEQPSTTESVVASSTGSSNGTVSTSSPTSSGSRSNSATPSPTGSASTGAPPAPSPGAAVPAHILPREILGAVVGVLGAALIL